MFKPHRAACLNCNNIRMIVVKKGFCKFCNEKSKGDKNWKKVFKPLPKKSDKRIKLDRAYGVMRNVFLVSHPICEANLNGCIRLSTDIHHLFWGKDREANMNDFTNVKAVCRPCHTYIHSVLSAAEAIKLGFKKI